MKKISPSIRNGVLYCVFFAALAGWLASDYFKSLEVRAYDTHMRNSEILTHQDIVLITIDDNSIEKIGDWPWSRDLLGKVIEYVNLAQPSVIALTEQMHEKQQDMGAQYLDKLREKINTLDPGPTLDALQKELDEAFLSINTDKTLADSMAKASHMILPVTLLPVQSKEQDSFISRKLKSKYAIEKSNTSDIGKTNQLFKVRTPNSLLVNSLDQFGHINKKLDKDDVLRSEHLLWPVDNYLVPSLSLRIYLQHQKNTQALDNKAPPFLPKTLSQNAQGNLILDNTELGIPANGQILSRFYSGQRVELFKQFSFYDVFVEAVPLQEFENKVILIGTTATGIGSKLKTSAGQRINAVESVAQVTSSLLNQDWIRRGETQRWVEAIIFLLIAGFLIFIAPGQKILTNILILISSSILLLIFEFGSLEFSHWYKFITPVIFFTFGMMALSVYTLRSKEFSQVKLSRERDQTNLQLGLAFQQQGALDLALEKFVDCTPTNNLLSPLYNLGLEYERKRQFAKATAVYEYMGKINNNYLDVQQRLEQAKNLAMHSTQQMFGSETRLSSLLDKNSDIENPRLGRYEIESEIGRGAMSIVYAGKDPTINRIVAIKVQRFVGDDEKQLTKMRERFLSEAKTAGHLNHPDIITIYDIGEEVDLIYIAMEYLSGSSLEHFSQHEPLDDQRIFDICIRIARALDYAHANKVIHRDVKPSNIIYDLNENKVHLTDFGIARMQDAHLTQTGQVLGTPSYMSPEQITGKRVDHRTDLFSLGATMYQLFTGKLPFQADTMATLLYKITMESPIPFDTIRPDLPVQLGAIIGKLLEKEADDRYQSAEELAKDLEDCKNSLKNIT